jgi:hypothetical protein
MNSDSVCRESEAQQLSQAVEQEVLQEIQQMAQTLVEASDDELFGETELQIRDQLLQIGRLLYQKRLEQKKTATMAAPPSAPTAGAPPTSRDIDHERC